MTPDEAIEYTLAALSDMPSGPPAKDILAAIQAAAWDEAIALAKEVAWEHDASASSAVSQIPNPHRPKP
jgi:hypothetical protein